MKTNGFIGPVTGLFVSILFTLTFDSYAQTSTTNATIPVVTIQATDQLANWAGDPGTFTVFRSGDPTMALNVYCCISGTASNGVDYQAIGNLVQLPSGVMSNTVVINPINLGQTDIKTVTLQLCPSPLMTPVNYSVGLPDYATVFITPPGVTNIPPEVNIINPTNGAAFFPHVVCPPCVTNVPPCDSPCYLVGPDISICAVAHDPDGNVDNVEFFANGTDLGAGHLVVLDPPGVNGVVGPVYFLSWTNVPPGDYSLTAVATDNGGASTTSDPVKISVLPGPPPTNLPPVVRIISPPNGAVFRAPVDIPLFAYAFDRDGFVTSLEFFDGTNSLGFGHPVLSPGPIEPPTLVSNLFTLVWSNAPVGTHLVTAEATDNGGAATTSDPIKIAVLPSPPPPTNRPPVVSVVATDPVAIEGTNCWPWVGLTNATPTWSAWTAPSPICRVFTNCGPKNATFTVFRHGATNDAITVAYAIGGTASNGVDYVMLPGVVTIPPGDHSASITVVPIDDGPPDITSTVVVKLLPDTNAPANYFLGFPRHAAAIILDGPWPRPVTAVLPDHCFHLATTGPDGAWFHVEYSTDLRNWIPICTNQVVNGSIDFIDPDAPLDNGRFYRAVPEANPPLE